MVKGLLQHRCIEMLKSDKNKTDHRRKIYNITTKCYKYIDKMHNQTMRSIVNIINI